MNRISRPSHPDCRNPQCFEIHASWFTRWWRPKGIWLNKKWYCSPECFEQGAVAEFSRINLRGGRSRPVHYRLPLGLLMLSKGFITRQDMEDALRAQRESQRGRIGEWLLHLGTVTEEQLTTALGMQWGCPVFHITETTTLNDCATMVPLYAMETARMVPVHYVAAKRTLYVAFSECIDFSTLRSLEQMLNCSTQPCVISQSEMEAAHERIRRMDRPSEMVLDFPSDVHDLAQEVRRWTESNDADRVGAVACPGCLWVRIESSEVRGHLVFRLQEAQSPALPLPALETFAHHREEAYS